MNDTNQENESFFASIIASGTNKVEAHYLKDRIIITKRLVFLTLGISTIYLPISFIVMPNLVTQVSMVILIFLYLIIFVFNQNGYHLISRFLVCLSPMLVLAFSHASMISSADTPIPSLVVFQITLLLIPWVLFDIREIGWIILLTITGLSLLIGIEMLHSLIGQTTDNTAFLKNPYYEKVNYVFAVIIICFALYFLQNQSRKSEKKVIGLLNEVEDKNQLLIDTEKKTGDYIRQLESAQEKEKERNWATLGLAAFSDIIHNENQDIRAFSNHILIELINYVEAIQGGLFLLREVNENEKYLDLYASYAYNRKKFLKKEIMITDNFAEGLVGQSFIDKKTIYLTDIPDDYISISSGMGESKPSFLLLVPLKINDDVFGILEMASLTEFQEYKIDFIERLAINIASAIANVRSNEKTRQLLEQTQEQAETLRAQEEEMRQNMEELLATQDMMKIKQEELQKTLENSERQTALLKEKEEKLSESQATLQLVIDNLPRGVFWKDLNLNYLGCNRIFADICLLPTEEVIGKNDFDMPWSKEDSEAFRADDRAVMESKQAKIDIEESQTNEKGGMRYNES